MTVRLWLLDRADALIRAEAALYEDDETGGMLLGYCTAAGVVVADAIGPGPRAERTPSWFLPDDEWQQDELARRYAASGRTHTYLGDWHTHPGGVPSPSRTDRGTLAKIAAHRPARQPAPLSAVLAPDASGTLAFWQHTGRWSKPALIATSRRAPPGAGAP